MTQTQFGQRLGISYAHISNIENGNDNPSDAIIKLIFYRHNKKDDLMNSQFKKNHARRLNGIVLMKDGVPEALDDETQKYISFALKLKELHIDLDKYYEFLAYRCMYMFFHYRYIISVNI